MSFFNSGVELAKISSMSGRFTCGLRLEWRRRSDGRECGVCAVCVRCGVWRSSVAGGADRQQMKEKALKQAKRNMSPVAYL